MGRYLDRSAISDVNRTSNFSAKTESQAEIKLIVNVSVSLAVSGIGIDQPDVSLGITPFLDFPSLSRSESWIFGDRFVTGRSEFT